MFQTTPQQPTITDGETNVPPDDTVSALEFSPQKLQSGSDFIVSGTWGNSVCCYQVAKNMSNQYVGELKASHQHQGPVLDVAWSDDCSKVFSASADKTVKMWDLQANQQMQVAAHDGPVRTVHWVKTSTYSCVATTSWDKTLKFWDLRSQTPASSITLPEKPYCADIKGSMAAISTALKTVVIYKLDPSPIFIKKLETSLKCHHKCISIFKDDKKDPVGFGLGSIEGRVALQHLQSDKPKDSFTFKCHRVFEQNGTTHDVYAVNDIAFHPIYNTMASIGGDRKYVFWDKDARVRIKCSETYDNPLTRCAFSPSGELFAFATGYDWSKGHEYSTPATNTNKIRFTYVLDDMKAREKKN